MNAAGLLRTEVGEAFAAAGLPWTEGGEALGTAATQGGLWVPLSAILWTLFSLLSALLVREHW